MVSGVERSIARLSFEDKKRINYFLNARFDNLFLISVMDARMLIV